MRAAAWGFITCTISLTRWAGPVAAAVAAPMVMLSWKLWTSRRAKSSGRCRETVGAHQDFSQRQAIWYSAPARAAWRHITPRQAKLCGLLGLVVLRTDRSHT